MAKLKDYYQKKQLMQQLSDELEKLEEDLSLKKDLEFEQKVRDLITEHDKTPSDILSIIAAIDPRYEAMLNPGKTTKTGNRREMLGFKNPHTGETVETRGANHKTLNEWRNQYGKEAVKSWRQND